VQTAEPVSLAFGTNAGITYFWGISKNKGDFVFFGEKTLTKERKDNSDETFHDCRVLSPKRWRQGAAF